MMHINEAGLDIIKRSESLRLRAYRDAVGIPTIGYGHTRTARMGTSITEPEAERLLREDLEDAESAVHCFVTVPLNENQFSALVSLVFNIGAGAFKLSTLRKLLNKGRYDEAAAQFGRWNKAGKKVLRGLVTRRAAEQSLFESPVS